MLRPDAFAAVMATGIVSVAAQDQHLGLVSGTLLALAMGALAMMAVLGIRRWATRDPDVVLGLFTFVAGCAVLATRLRNHPPVFYLLAATAVLGWGVLTPLAARAMWSCGWRALRDRAHGGWELASVATSGVAIALADLGALTRHPALVSASTMMWVLGIAIYALMTSLILWRVSARAEFAPDHWILMGGLAIATLAAARLHIALAAVTWLLATAWIPVLGYVTVKCRPRLVQFGWWAMVFPIGMYSSASYATAVATGWTPLTIVSSVFFWTALAAWSATAVISLLRPTVFAWR